MRVQKLVCSGLSVCLHKHVAFSYCLSLKMDFEKSFLATYSVRGHFCHLLKAAPEHDKRRAELLFPFGEFWDPCTSHCAGGEAKTPDLPRLWICDPADRHGHGTGLGFIHSAALLIICYSAELSEEKEMLSTPFNLFLFFSFIS